MARVFEALLMRQAIAVFLGEGKHTFAPACGQHRSGADQRAGKTLRGLLK
jgi:hypothetical protein